MVDNGRMKKHPKIIAGATSIVLLFAGLLWFNLRPEEPEPSYQGKPLSAWLRGFDAPEGSPKYEASRSAIRHFGTNVVPRLVDYLHHKDPPFHRQWVNVKTKLNMNRGEVDFAVWWHKRAAHACGALGADAATAFPALTEAMNTRGAASDVGIALSNMMPESVPVLTNVLAKGTVLARGRAAENLYLAFSYPETEPMARTALIAALNDLDHGVRASAASAFGLWNIQLDSVVTALTQALSDPHPSVRGNAASTLGRFGTNSTTAVPELLKLLQDNSPYVRGTVADRAAIVLSEIDPEAAIRAGVK